MKLYVWKNVLQEWTSGVAFALASSPEEAKELLIQTGLKNCEWDGLKLDGQDYVEYDKPFAYYL